MTLGPYSQHFIFFVTYEQLESLSLASLYSLVLSHWVFQYVTTKMKVCEYNKHLWPM